MIYDHVGAIRDPLKQDWNLNFTETQKNSSLFETHINHDQINHIRNNYWAPTFLSWIYTKGMFFLFHLGLEGITEVDADPKGRFVSFKVTPSNDRFLCLYLFRV